MKISVIVPVYNAEKFLNNCIESVVHQSYTNWELLLIDDGSSDSSAEIMKAACKNDARIKEFHQKNAGPGIARNKGIEIATGDYIVFWMLTIILIPNILHYWKKIRKKILFLLTLTR